MARFIEVMAWRLSQHELDPQSGWRKVKVNVDLVTSHRIGACGAVRPGHLCGDDQLAAGAWVHLGGDMIFVDEKSYEALVEAIEKGQ